MPQLAVHRPLPFLFLLAFATAPLAATAQTFSVLHAFTGGVDGATPAGVILDPAGNLYGTAESGGTGSCPSSPPGCGTIFELKKHNGSYTFNPLYSFQGGMDGVTPVQPPALGPDGTLYGTTFQGGDTCESPGCGVVFHAEPSPTPQRTPLLKFQESVLYSFSGGSDGGSPKSTLIFDRAGNMYGTTSSGGEHNGGTVFELSPAGGGTYTKTVLYNFCSIGEPPCADGLTPVGGLIFDAVGNLYGTTEAGGARNEGMVFKLSPSGAGWTEQILYSFQGIADGVGGNGVVMDSGGFLYGNTYQGGENGSGSTVYVLIPNGGNWTYSLLYAAPFGAVSSSTVTLDVNGNLYESLSRGGTFGYGQILELVRSSNWTPIDLHDFTGGSDGLNPYGAVVLDSSGNLYGTDTSGGSPDCGGFGCGVAWEITP